MMIDKRLVGTVRESKKYILGNVVFQWLSLAANIGMMCAIAALFQGLWQGSTGTAQILRTALIAALAAGIRYFCAVASSRMSYLSSKAVKKTLRQMIYRKLLRLGSAYTQQVNTSEVVQVAVEGVEQLETYFGAAGIYAKPGNEVAELVGVKNWGKGLKILIAEDNSVTIDVDILICYGYSVVDVADNVQTAVASAVESMTGVKVHAVNVNVCGISRK